MINNVSNTIDTLFSKMEHFISTKTVIGEAIIVGNATLLPLIDVSFGVGAGGGGADNSPEADDAKGGGAGGGLGAKLTPSAVVVVMDDSVQLINIKNQDSVNKLIDLVPGIAAKISELLSSKKEQKAATKEEETL